VPGAVKQTVAQELRCRILPCWFLFSKARHNNNRLLQVAFLSLCVILVFDIIVSYDGNFINDDPTFQVSQSSIVLTCHYIKARLIKCFGETVHLSLIATSNLLSRAPPIA